VHGSNLWSSGDYILNSYKGSKNGIEDNFYYLSDDKIYDMLVQNVSGSSIFNSILGCDDSSVRVLVENEVYYSQNFNSPVLSLHDASSFSTTSTPNIAYGLKNGSFGMIDMQRDSPLILWDVNSQTATLSSDAPINIMHCGKLLDDATDNDIIIARLDGSCEIYSYRQGEQPYRKYCLNFQESVVGLGMGNISRSDHKEVVVSLFSGKISGLIDSNAEMLEEDNQAERKQKIDQLAKEKDQLMKKKVKKVAKVNDGLAGDEIVGFKAHHTFTLLPNEAAYQLTIETQVNMSILMLQSSINIDILDEDNIPAIVSFPATDESQDSNQFLITLKMNEETNRIVLKIRTSEGLFGSINAFVIPAESSSKVCKRIEIPILPLSLHEKISAESAKNEKDNPLLNKDDLELSSITLTGNFSQNDILNWISKCLYNVPKIQDTQEIVIYYRSTFVGTYLILSLGDGKCTISTNNLSAMTIIKGKITSEASEKGKRIDISSKIIDER